MLRNRFGALLVSLSLIAVPAAAKPVMVSVRLTAEDQIRSWRELAIPTYALVSGLAIAELDDGRIPDLARRGFSCSVWDEQPWSADYYYFRDPGRPFRIAPATVVFRDGDLCVAKGDPARRKDIIASPLRPARLEPIPLTERFWDRASRKIIGLNSLPWDPFIQGLVDQVNADSIIAGVQRLQDFKTRLFLLDSCYAAEEWLEQRFTGWGYPVEFDSFYLSLAWPRSGWDRNVIATRTGDMVPGRIVIVCGHHDCIVWPDSTTARVNAPGADDNATGCAGAMEIARVFRGYGWEPTFKFVGWAAEEMGLYGSHHFSSWADSQDLDIQAVINLDMTGFMNDAVLDCNVQSHGLFTAWLSTLIAQAGQVYVPSLLLHEEVWSGGSDDLPFYQHGYPATCNIERWYYQNPNYHKVTDVIANTSPALYTLVTKACLAAAAVLGTYPSAVEAVSVRDLGDGRRLEITWSANPETDVTGYRVYWSRQSGVYQDSVQTSQLGDTLTGLQDDSLYYIIVRAIDADGHPSPLAYEAAGRPVRLVRVADNQTFTPWLSVQPTRPNPFINNTRFEYRLPVDRRVTIKIYNDAGQLVITLMDQIQAAGSHAVTWGGNDEEGRPVASGIYFYVFSVENERISGQVILIR